MSNPIEILQDDMRDFARAGFSILDYRTDHAISALIFADIDPRKLLESPQSLLLKALEERCRKALGE